MIDRLTVLAKLDDYLTGNELARQFLENIETCGFTIPAKINELRTDYRKVQKIRDAIESRTISYSKLDSFFSEMTDHEFAWFSLDEFIERIEPSRNVRAEIREIENQFELCAKFCEKITAEQVHELFVD
jgi:hypothetical protein